MSEPQTEQTEQTEPTISAETLAQLRRLEREATRPPWRFYREVNTGDFLIDNWSPRNGNYNGVIVGGFGGKQYSPYNADLVTQLRNAAPALIAAAEESVRLRSEVERLRGLLDAMSEHAKELYKFDYMTYVLGFPVAGCKGAIQCVETWYQASREQEAVNERLRTENADLRRRLVGAEEAGKVVEESREMRHRLVGYLRAKYMANSLCIAYDESLLAYDRAVTAGQESAAGEVEGEG